MSLPGPSSNPALHTVRLPIQVVMCTSEQDESTSARVLETLNPRSQGWVSARFCDFPQVLGFELCTPEAPAQTPGWSHHKVEGRDSDDSHGEEEDDEDSLLLTGIQVLANETCIPQSIEVFAATGGGLSAEFADEARFMDDITEHDYIMEEFRSSNYTHVGTLTFREETPSQARELQTLSGFRVPDCKFVLLRVTGCHTNAKNIFLQAGIAAITMSGVSTRYARALERIRSYVGGHRVQQPPGFEEHAADNIAAALAEGTRDAGGASASEGFQDMYSPRFNIELQTEMSRFSATTKIHRKPQPSDMEFSLKYDGWTAKLLGHVINAKEHYVLVEDFDAADDVKNVEESLRSSKCDRLTSLHNQRTKKLLEDDVQSVKDITNQLTTERLLTIKDVLDVRALGRYFSRIVPTAGQEVAESIGHNSLKSVIKEADRLRNKIEGAEKKKRRRKKRLLKKAIRVTREKKEEQELWTDFMDGVALQRQDPIELAKMLKLQAEADQEDEFRKNRGGNAKAPDSASSGRGKLRVEEKRVKEDHGMAERGEGKGQATDLSVDFL